MEMSQETAEYNGRAREEKRVKFAKIYQNFNDK